MSQEKIDPGQLSQSLAENTVVTPDSAAPRLFGTDGIRGTSNKFPMTPETVVRVGQAMGYILRKTTRRRGQDPMVLIGKDTRLSGYMLEQALSSGLNSMGVRVQLVGPLPTPGIGYLAQNMRADAGIVISASHNAYLDNGIKIFGPDGFKISDRMERQIETLVYNHEELASKLVESKSIGRTRRIEDSMGRYVVFAKNTFPLDLTLDGFRIVLDCANGAAYKVAPAIFEELGAEVIVLGNAPNGFNINDKTGALYPNKTCEAVLKYRADVGISLDGDADRVIMVDETGNLINGDHILAICAIHLKKLGKLNNDVVVATQMSNYGLDQCLSQHGIRVERTDVGDKHVVECMRKNNYVLGGEQSGHIIFLDHSTTGDGCVAALNMLAVALREKKRLSELNEVMQDMPQVLINTRVKERVPFDQIEGFDRIMKEVETALDGKGRIFVRYSGTEPLVRVLVEGPSQREIASYADTVADFLQKELG